MPKWNSKQFEQDRQRNEREQREALAKQHRENAQRIADAAARRQEKKK